MRNTNKYEINYKNLPTIIYVNNGDDFIYK